MGHFHNPGMDETGALHRGADLIMLLDHHGGAGSGLGRESTADRAATNDHHLRFHDDENSGQLF
jgi:hypothetical protein